MRERFINRPQVHLHDFIAFLRIRFANRILNRFDRVLRRQHAGDGEETGLHDGVDAAAHSAVPRNFVSVDDEEVRAAAR